MPRACSFGGLLLGGACLLALAPVARAGSPSAESKGVRAVFSTQAEAAAAAPRFGCKGAHRMGKQWMPCASHGETSGDPPAMPHH